MSVKGFGHIPRVYTEEITSHVKLEDFVTSSTI